MTRLLRIVAVTLMAVSAYAQSGDGQPATTQTVSTPGGTTNSIALFSGKSTISNSRIYQKGGNIGIGTTTPAAPLTVNGAIQSLAGGFTFPDNSVQATAGITAVNHDGTMTGTGSASSPLGVNNPLNLIGSNGSPAISVVQSNTDGEPAVYVNNPTLGGYGIDVQTGGGVGIDAYDGADDGIAIIGSSQSWGGYGIFGVGRSGYAWAGWFQGDVNITGNLEDRKSFLDRECAGDSELRREVESLLASVDKSLGFLEAPLHEIARQLAAESEGPGSRIQAYELLKVIGEGGMGKVYLAARADDHFNKQVAIKLLQAGFAQTTAMLLRFRSERQILADLDHPNIARLLDGGVTPSGLPFLAMEYVDGIPIHQYCRQNALSVEQRLRLFVTVCGAVDYAHKHLVVHRDIKPANILVTKEGTAKLLDFGIAKLIDAEQGSAAQTRTLDRLMTPEYASPEQITGGAVTTATDVYALGVVLYELLSGLRPFNLATMTPVELCRAICERDPEAPSARVARIDGPSAAASEKIDGELDNIVLMAMRKEPGRRYRSARELADDITAYLNGYPVRAKTATLGYRSAKFIRRNRAAAAFATLAVAALIVFSVGMAILAKRARSQQAIAERESGFLSSIFAASMPIQARGNQVTARDLLDRGVQRVDRELSGEPEAQAAMLQSIGRSYHALGLYDQAKPLLERAYSLRRNLFGEGDLRTAESAEDLATTDRLRSEYGSAENLFRSALGVRERKLGPNDSLVTQSLTDLGDCLIRQNREFEAEPVLRRALAICRRNNDPLGAETRGYLAAISQHAGNYADAAALLREAAEIYRQTQGEDTPDYLMTMHNLAGSLIDSGDLLGAEKSERQVIELRRKVDPGHPDLAYSLNNLGWILLEEGNWQEAESFLRENLEITGELGSRSDRVATAQNNWGHYLQEKGDYAGANASYNEALKKMIELRGSDSWQTAKVRFNIGQLKFDQRDYAAADTEFADILALSRKLGGDNHPQVATLLIALAEAKMFEGRSAEAEPMLRQALSIREKRLNPGHPAIMIAQVRLGEALTAQGRAVEAEPLLRQAVRSTMDSPFPLVRWQMGEAEGALGACLSVLGQHSEADQLLQRSKADLEHHPRPAFVDAPLHLRGTPPVSWVLRKSCSKPGMSPAV